MHLPAEYGIILLLYVRRDTGDGSRPVLPKNKDAPPGAYIVSMEYLIELIHNGIVLTVGAAFLVAQFLKFLLNAIIHRRFSAERLRGDGGMPSAHSATVTALAIMIGYTEGFDSGLFAVALVFAVIVMHDAMGVRRETEKQTSSILQLFSALNDLLQEKDKIVQQEKLKRLVGHSPLQVFFGILTGTLVALASIAIFGF